MMVDVTVTVHSSEEYDDDWIPENLVAAIDWLRAYLESVPEQFRNNVEIKFGTRSSYDSSYADMSISYRRPETEAETAERKARNEANRLYAEQRDRATYEHLRAKFEGTTR